MKNWPINALPLFVFILITTIGCKKKENNLGLATQPQGDELNVLMSDTTKLITYIESQDSIQTDELSGDNLFGSYVDPYFGKIEAALFTQLRISSAVDFTPASGSFNDIVIDSVRLYLKLSNAYGNVQAQDFEVYQLNTDLDIDSDYYSTTTIDSLAGNLVVSGEESIAPKPYSLGAVEGHLTQDAILSIPLDVNAFGWNILNQSGTTALSGNDGTGQFVDWFSGLLIKTNTASQSVNEGAILYTDLLNENSKIVLFYRDTVVKDTIAFDFNFNAQTARYHRINMDYTGSFVGNELADSTLGQTQFFTQTMAGVKGKVFFPNLEEYIKDKKIIVNRAELILPAQYYTTDAYVPSTQLYITRTDTTGKEVFIDDFAEEFGGKFNFDDNEYVFNITRYINQVFSGKHQNKPLSIVPNRSGISANRVVFNGQESLLKDKPRLKLTFTKY